MREHIPYLIPSQGGLCELCKTFRVFFLDGSPQRKEKESDARNDTRYGMTHLSFQKLRSSSMVLAAPRILANNTSTPASLGPQKALQ